MTLIYSEISLSLKRIFHARNQKTRSFTVQILIFSGVLVFKFIFLNFLRGVYAVEEACGIRFIYYY